MVANQGSSPYTDSYPLGQPLNIINSANNYSPGTNAAIIAGKYVPDGTGNPLTFSWRTRSQNEMASGSSHNQNLPSNASYLASDVLNMTGQLPGYDYVLQMDFSPQVETPSNQQNNVQAGNALYLGTLVNQSDITTWANAVTEDVANTVYSTTINPITHHSTTQSAELPAVGVYAYNPNETEGRRHAGEQPAV